ncbi:hypothetical protein [Cellulomonas dongxiuzhuiae]|uniref:Uncharacterized protein n=1 Tax=Cellulomonas dongxiuzhuiae TaxID=2819979 RepID=A0ABX8GHN7_9CELL|nr:hypothetical protein [Cellulomonas dongxiuzhuiae]MBO3094701.1 hypothetical protein [Cellulomonas dongxiuzhuiae]QWC15704.1 hypothetical protein KKR89_15695 [Cellulomonas dongxiuzhuiae]
MSYLGADEASPLHAWWGAEAVVLGAVAVVAAFTAGPGSRRRVRALLACSPAVLFAGMLALGY